MTYQIDLTDFNPEREGKINQNRKENHYYRTYLAVVPTNKFKSKRKFQESVFTPVEIRLYGTGQKNYACAWVRNGVDIFASGGGNAGGYGYDRESEAVEDALRDMGIKTNIGGAGETAIREIIIYVAVAMLGCKMEDVSIIVTHA